MHDALLSIGRLTDSELIAHARLLAAREWQATADLVASLAEIDARKLYLREGCSSLFEYCTTRLRLDEGAAYNRIKAARAVRQFPTVLERLADGRLSLTAAIGPEQARSKATRFMEAAVGTRTVRPCSLPRASRTRR